MKKYLIAIMALMVLFPAFALSDIVSFRVGFFFPQANSDLWTTEFDNMDFQKSDFNASNFSFMYEYFLSNELSIMFGLDSYTKQRTGTYLDFVGDTVDNWDYAFDYGAGFPIAHVFSVSMTPVQVSVKLTPLGRRMRIIPYIGGGASLYIWSVRLQGDMIDFSAWEEFYDSTLDDFVIGYEIFTADAREENKFAVGFQAFGGIMVPVANRVSLEAEFKYSRAKGSLKEAFEGFEDFDLGGYQFSIGMNYWF